MTSSEKGQQKIWEKKKKNVRPSNKHFSVYQPSHGSFSCPAYSFQPLAHSHAIRLSTDIRR